MSRRPSQFADRQQPVNCKLVSPNNALVAVGLTLDAVLERLLLRGGDQRVAFWFSGGRAMTRWEYHFIQVTNAPFLHSGTVPDFVNELGRDGWELVGFDVHNQAWFKRPLQDIGEEGSVPGRQA